MSEPTQPNEPAVVDLVDAGVPADQGLSSLGMLMQLAGNVFAAYAALLAFVVLFAQRGGGAGAEMLWMFLILGLAITRSLLQRAAGSQLVFGLPAAPGNRLAGIRRYAIFAVAQSLVTGALLAGKFDASVRLAIGVTGGLLVWPVVLLVLMRLPRFKRFQVELPVTEDKGFEGASILMAVLGSAALIGTGTVLAVLLHQPGRQLQSGPGVLVGLALVILLIRSALHVQAGVSGLRETSVDRSVERANRYATFGVISSFCCAGAMMLFVMASAMSVAGLALVCGMCWMLMAWPMIIRRFFSDRQFADLLAGDAAPIHRRAPDAGITWLGWLLVAYAAYMASFLVPELLIANDGDREGMLAVFALAGAAGTRSLWWSVGITVLQGWAGFELVRMSRQSKAIATVYGVVGSAVSLYINWPLLQTFRDSAHLGPSDAALIGPIALALMLPIATIVLVHRKIAPTARARFRPRE